MFKKVLYNIGAQVAGKVITASSSFLVSVLVVRSLGKEGFGDYTKIFVFVGYFYTLADFGLNSIYVKQATAENQTLLLKSLFGLRIVVSLILIGIAYTIITFLPYNHQTGTGFSPQVKVGIIIASATILTQALFTTANAYFQKILRYDLSTIAAIIGSLTLAITCIAFTILHIGLLGYTGAYVIEGIVFITVAFWLIFKKTKHLIRPRFPKEPSLHMLKAAWPVGVALIFNLVYFRIDVFILSYFRSSGEVGIYGLAYQFFEAALTIPIFFTNAIYPLLTNLKQTNELEFKKQTLSWIKILLLISIGVTISLAVIAYIIPIFYGSNLSPAIKSLHILALGMPFFFLSALLWNVLIIYDKQKFLTGIYAIGTAFNIITNLIFIPRYGFIAASTTTVFSEALIMTILALVLIRINNDQKHQIRNAKQILMS